VNKWTEHKTKDGRKFWHNSSTNKSTWEKPDELKTDHERLLAKQTSWKEYVAADGRTYWYNKDTRESVWHMPDEVKKLQEESEKYVEEWPKFDNKTLAKEKLCVLFELRGVTHHTKWDEAQRLIQADTRYNCFEILSTGEKKQTFSEFVTQANRKARDVHRQKRVKARESLVEALYNWPDLQPNSKYATFASAFKHSWWFDQIDEVEKDELFHDCMDDYEKRYREDRRRLRNEQMKKLIVKYGQNIQLSYLTRWTTVQEVMKDDADFNALEKLEALTAWEDFVYESEKTEKENRRQNLFRQQRHVRDAFVALLDDNATKGILTYKTNWIDFMAILQNDQRYLNMIGQPGLTAHVLFDDKVYELEQKFAKQKSLVKKLVRNAGIQITPTSTFEWFYESLRPQEEFSKVSQINAKLAFEHFVRKAAKSCKRSHEEAIPEGDSPGVKKPLL